MLDDRLGEGGELDTANGRLRFLRVVGITGEELSRAGEELSATLAGLDPPNVTDLGRV